MISEIPICKYADYKINFLLSHAVARIISIGPSAHLGLGHDELHVGREQQLALGAAEPAERLDVLAVVHLSRNGGTAASNLHIGIWS